MLELVLGLILLMSLPALSLAEEPAAAAETTTPPAPFPPGYQPWKSGK